MGGISHKGTSTKTPLQACWLVPPARGPAQPQHSWAGVPERRGLGSGLSVQQESAMRARPYRVQTQRDGENGLERRLEASDAPRSASVTTAPSGYLPGRGALS